MEIKQFRYNADNFSYLVYGEKLAMVIDGGAVPEILDFLDKQNLFLKYATFTHSHYDHTMGTPDLLEETGAELLDNKQFKHKQIIELETIKIEVLKTPGHTMDGVTFHIDDYLITGDTLFNGSVGNCFSGDLDSFFKSIKLLLSFPEDTIIFCGHDYVEDSLDASIQIEPDNPHFEEYMAKYNRKRVCSTIKDELKVNPYLRYNEESIINLLKENSLPMDSELDRWKSLMENF